jgi:hypothetical protein
MKTRMYKNAFDEINAIGDYLDPVNCYETYTQYNGTGLKGVFVVNTICTSFSHSVLSQ